MKVEIVNVDTIKPSSPTPLHLKTYTLSALDQAAPSMFSTLVFAYPNVVSVAGVGYDQFSQTLKNSLSDTLTLFPPLAGRTKVNNVSVDCNDDGVPCYESGVHSTLDHLLSLLHDRECLKHMFVDGDEVNVDTGGAQLLVQINQFDCGGIALGLSYSHKLCDAASFATFIKSWSAKAISSSSQQVIVPDFTVSTNFPPRKDDIFTPLTNIRRKFYLRNDLISARLVFDGEKIAALKEKSVSLSTPQPTRVEAVTALIAKCSMIASRASNESYLLPYLSLHSVNIRKKIVPSLPETAFGNVLGGYQVVHSEQGDVSLDILVDKLRKGRTEYLDSLALVTGQKMVDEHLQNLVRVGVTSHGDALEMFAFTSWCRFGAYDIDFGLGKPIWVGRSHKPKQNLVYLSDTKDGNGVEAHVTLPKKVMALFQTDPLLLSYAYVNPSL